MARKGGFERFLMSMAKEAARQQRVAATARQRELRESERERRQRERQAEQERRYAALSAKEDAKVRRQIHLEAREAEAQERNQGIHAVVSDLRGVLQHSLTLDDTVSFDSLRVTSMPPKLFIPSRMSKSHPAPSRDEYLGRARLPRGVAKLLPGARTRRQRALESAEADYEAALQQWRRDEGTRLNRVEELRSTHKSEVAAFDAKVNARNIEVDTFRDAYFSLDADAVVAYNSMVLERSSYPDGFPQKFSLAYSVASKQLVVEYELPAVDVVPDVNEYRYVKARDLIEAKARRSAEIKEIYQEVVASIALRTLHELFEADQASAVDTCCFNGYVHTVDPATGNDTQPHLISVRATKDIFLAINLARVDKATCLRNLGAQVSRHPAEAQPVKPIVEFNMADARFIDQADLVSGLSGAPNLMDLTPSEFEQLVANLFGKMGLESKLTRSSRDGGVDCIAYDARPILGGKVVIQAKRYRHTVGVSAVRDLYGTMMNEGANKGILVTTSGYGKDAFSFSADKPIELIDGGGLLFLLQEAGTQARIIFPTE